MISKAKSVAACAPLRGVLLVAAVFSVLWVLVLALVPALADPADAAPSVQARTIEFVEISGVIDLVSANLVRDVAEQAVEKRSAAILVRLNGGEAVAGAAERVAREVHRSRVPVIVWVAPQGVVLSERAALVLAAGDVRAMSPGTAVRSRGRLLSARDLLAKHEVDVIAISTAEVFARSGDAGGPVVFRFHKLGLFARLGHAATRPWAAYLLLLLGIFGLIFELYNPGIGGAAVAGVIAISFALYGFALLPTSWPMLALTILAVILFAVDMHRATLWVPTVAGALIMVAAGRFLFATPFTLSWWAIGAGILLSSLFFLSAMTAAIQARTARPLSGAENIVGTIGVARTDISPEGQVMARGTLWRARTLGAAIAQGVSVEIKGTSGLLLVVEPVEAPVTKS